MKIFPESTHRWIVSGCVSAIKKMSSGFIVALVAEHDLIRVGVS